MSNRRSYCGIIIYVNNVPITWYNKHKNAFESSSFGLDFIAPRFATEMVKYMRYKLRCVGVPVDGATEGFCDNKSVVKN